jgi:heme/copper-type cytochrome/quinol oxidase subunit 2
VICVVCAGSAFSSGSLSAESTFREIRVVRGIQGSLPGQDQAPGRREVKLLARDYQFIPNKIEVTQDDLVRVMFTSEGRPTSFAVDAYRILKRAGANQTIVFEFRADQAGTFSFYCSLTSDRQCREMKGTLVVHAK